MKQKLLNSIKMRAILLTTILCAVFTGQAWAQTTATINFNNSNSGTAINNATVYGDDSAGNEWTISTAGTTSFTANASYYQVGSSNNPATSITFTTTLPDEVTITAFSAKFGGFKSTAGNISLLVDDDEVASGSLSGTSDVTVSTTNSVTGTELKVTITSIAKGVKAYYISYTYESASGSGATASDLALTGDPITLNFDLYNNKSAQVIDYTTSSTGTVSVVSNDYVDATVNAETKKISITPKKVTGSAQTITVRQAADDTYAAGEQTFKVNITDSTPKETFEKITSAADLATGDELILVYETGNIAAGTRGENTYLAPVTVEIDKTNNEIEVPVVGSDVNVFVICDDNDKWTLYSKLDDEYIYESAVKKLATGNNDPWSISFDNDGNAIVSGSYPIRYNASSPRFTTYDGSGQDIQLYRKVVDRTALSVGTTGYTTYVTKKNVSFPAGVSAYIVTGTGTSSVTLTEVTSAPVNTALIIKAVEDDYVLTEEDADDCDDVSANLLYSSNGYFEGDGSKIYALGKKNGTVGFYLVGDGEAIPVGKAFLEVVGGDSGSVKEFMSFNFGGEDAIESVFANGQLPMDNAAIFNLAGQRVNRATKGVFIQNGRKFIVK